MYSFYYQQKVIKTLFCYNARKTLDIRHANDIDSFSLALVAVV